MKVNPHFKNLPCTKFDYPMHFKDSFKMYKKKIIKKVSADFKLTTYILYLSQEHCATPKDVQKCIKMYIVFNFVTKNYCPWL